MSKLVRYKLCKDIKYLYENQDLGEKYPCCSSVDLFVDILEVTEHALKLKVYMSSDEVVIGWQSKYFFPLKLHNEELLYDGRFNLQEK